MAAPSPRGCVSRWAGGLRADGVDSLRQCCGAVRQRAAARSRGAGQTVRFIGEASFHTGTWIGVELDQAVGKNDGSVNGRRYFQCRPNHGVFVRPSDVRGASARLGPLYAPR